MCRECSGTETCRVSVFIAAGDDDAYIQFASKASTRLPGGSQTMLRVLARDAWPHPHAAGSLMLGVIQRAGVRLAKVRSNLT